MGKINFFPPRLMWMSATVGCNIASSLPKMSYPFVNCWFIWGIIPINFCWSIIDFNVLPSEFHQKFAVCSYFNFIGIHIALIRVLFKLLPFLVLVTKYCSEMLLGLYWCKKKCWNLCMISYNMHFPWTSWRFLKYSLSHQKETAL